MSGRTQNSKDKSRDTRTGSAMRRYRAVPLPRIPTCVFEVQEMRRIKRLFWKLRLRWLESKIREPFDKKLSLKIDRALDELGGMK